MSDMIETDVVIIGTGPAGAVAATLLADMGIRTLAISRYRSTSPGPRAHITNQRAMEILRDLGLEEAAKDLAVPQEDMGEHVYGTSLAGEEFGRIRTWSTDALKKAEHDLASPCSVCDLPQLYFEPLVVNAASLRGADIRFKTEYLSHTQSADEVIVRLRDLVTETEYDVRAKYLIGADGARSKVAEDIALPFEGEMSMGSHGSLNIEFTADLSPLVSHRKGDMYWMIQPGDGFNGAGVGVLRMVRPWNKWVCVSGYDMSKGAPSLTEDQARGVVQKVVGTKDIPIEIDAMSTWTINQQYAQRNSEGRVFCMGDAVHRHTPMAGLGLNTSVQDAYNLCWKLAMVIKGQAGDALLESYDAERTPVAKEVVDHTYMCLSKLPPIFMALGLKPAPSQDDMDAALDRLKARDLDGAERRATLRNAMNDTLAGFGGALGLELNQRYTSSAVHSDGTEGPHFERDRVTHYQASSRPGAHLPHVWLTRHQRPVSTLDLCGKGQFTLLTGLAGAAWAQSAEQSAKDLGIEIAVHIIGPGQDYVDTYGDFSAMSEVQEDGALLVRPDMMVAWRSPDASDANRGSLINVLRKILSAPSNQRSVEVERLETQEA